MRYIVAGLINSIFGYTVFLTSFYVLSFGSYISNILAYGLGLIVSLIQMRTWVFPSGEILVKYAIKFLMIYIVSYLLNLAVFTVLLSVNEIVPPIAQIGAMGVYSLSFFILSKKFLHRQVFESKLIN